MKQMFKRLFSRGGEDAGAPRLPNTGHVAAAGSGAVPAPSLEGPSGLAAQTPDPGPETSAPGAPAQQPAAPLAPVPGTVGADAGENLPPAAPGADPETPDTSAPPPAPAADAEAPSRPGEVPPGSGEAPSGEAPGDATDKAAEPIAGEAPVAAPVSTDAAAPESGSAPPESGPAAPASVAAPLVAGAVIGERYTVVRSLTGSDAAQLLGVALPVTTAELYAVEDRRAHERCWSCGSTANGEQQRFCVDCGAPLQHRQAVLARTLQPTGDPEEFAEAGAYFHLIRPRKQFGSTGITLEVAGFSAEGPHHPNEDSYWCAVAGGCFDSVSQMFGVLTLADGMGGYAPGSGLISKQIVSLVGRGVFGILHDEPETQVREADLQAIVRGAIAQANGQVLQEIQQHGEMGATLVTAVIYGETAYIANIGDSRAYYIAPSGTVTQITRDQSLIEQQVASGLLSPDAVYTALGNNVILHAIGEDGVEEAFDWYTQPLEPGGRLLLCSDGYWKTMQQAVWDPQAAAGQQTLRDLARALVEGALAANSDDNTTVLVASFD